MRRIGRALLGTLLVAMVGYAAWGWVESRRLAAAIETIARRGEPTSPTDRTGVSLTGEQQDAARIYAAAVERLQDDTRDEAFRFGRLDVDNPAAAAGSLDELESRYRKDASPLQLLDQATPLAFAGFGGVAPELESRPEPLAALSALNALRADLLSMRGRGDEAAHALLASVRLQRTVARTFNRYVAATRILGSLRILLRHTSPSDQSLRTLQRAFETLPDEDTLAQEMLQSRAEFVESLRRPGGGIAEALARRLFAPWFAREARRQLGYFDSSLSLLRLPLPERFNHIPAFEREMAAQMQPRWTPAIFFVRFLPRGAAFGGTSLPAAAYDLATRRIAVTALAIERYRHANRGSTPSSLDTLVPAYLPAVPRDPFSGKVLIYRRGPEDYLLYSVDTNLADDGGAIYGIGSRGQMMPWKGAPRDYGLRVPLKSE